MIDKVHKAGSKEWLGLTIIALPCMIYAMDLTILNLAVPKLSEDLEPSGSQLLWIVDIYGFLVAGLLITMGTLGDKIGRRKLLLFGAATFGLASLLAAFSSSANLLILSRAILGVAGATLAPSTLSLIRNMFHNPKERTMAIGVWITSFSVGGAIGPVVGGIIIEYYWWGAVFLVSIPVMLLLLLLGPRLLPEFRDPDAGRIDLASVFLSLGAVLFLIYGVKDSVQAGLNATAMITALVGLGAAFIFFKRQERLSAPLLDLNLFRDRMFSVSLGLYAFSTFALFGMFFFVAQYLQLVLGLSPFMAGLWGLPSAAGFIIGSLSVSSLTRVISPVYLMAVGCLVAASGFSFLIFLNGQSDLITLVTGFTVFSLGCSPVFTLATDVVVGSAPPQKAGIASSLSETSSELGGAMGIAILGSIGTLVYKQGLKNATIPDAISADTLGGVVASLSQGSGPQSGYFLDLARQSFVAGLNLAAAIAALISLILAVLCVVVLRNN